MKNFTSKTCRHIFLLLMASCCLTGCVGTVVGAVVDTAVEVVKIPFKVGGAVIDVVTPDKVSDDLLGNGNGREAGESDIDSDAAAVEMESDGI